MAQHRHLTAEDVIVGQAILVWNGEDYTELTIEEVLRPSDLFKGYTADDGCRYGLEGAYLNSTPNKAIAELVHTVKTEIARHLHYSNRVQTERQLTELLIKELQND